MEEFRFLTADGLEDGEIYLEVERQTPGDEAKGLAPDYLLAIHKKRTGEKVGELSLRIGYNERLYYGGHIGYAVQPEHRGNHYAAKACRLAFRLARAHGMERLLITCNPENFPSRRTCELVDAKLLEIAELPPDNDMYRRGEPEKCIYEVDLRDIDGV